jgi:uncharacterized protein
MGRLLVLIVLVVAAVWLVKRALRGAKAKDAAPDAAAGQAEPKASQELVRCAHCALLLPRGEARMSSGVIYCSEEHAKLGAGGR